MQQNFRKKSRKLSLFHIEITLRTKRADNKLIVSKLVSKDPFSDETYFSDLGSQELFYFSLVKYHLQNVSRTCI